LRDIAQDECQRDMKKQQNHKNVNPLASIFKASEAVDRGTHESRPKAARMEHLCGAKKYGYDCERLSCDTCRLDATGWCMHLESVSSVGLAS
jgi:hypothetical protein